MFVDSSVWIDFFRNEATAQAERLAVALDSNQLIIVGDLVITEVLQGFQTQRAAEQALALIDMCMIVPTGGREIAIAAAANFRSLRARGITVRKTIDTLIATWCITHDVPLLHNDRDFDPFAQYLGLRIVSAEIDIGS